MDECRALGGCRPGDAKVTGAGKLKAQYIVHAVGPVWQGGDHGEPVLLASCYNRALELADEHGCRRIALPSISTGAYGFPHERAAGIAVASTIAAMRAHPRVIEARFWLYNDLALALYIRTLDDRCPRDAVEAGETSGDPNWRWRPS